MQGISSGPSAGPQMYAMKKAIDVQAQQTLKILESSSLQTQASQQNSGASLTGVGQKLDIKG